MTTRRRTGRSQRPLRHIGKRFVIVCEGQTEIAYFGWVKSSLRTPLITLAKTEQNDPLGLVKQAIGYRDGDPKRMALFS
ncbi:MAG: RloB family protein [Bifidobacteriaceae bacterium]|nr:RloB family protein [Bifidobacteriaceae bacterium]